MRLVETIGGNAGSYTSRPCGADDLEQIGGGNAELQNPSRLRSGQQRWA